MRFLHCSDLHLGRRLCELDLLEDQKYILDQLLDIAASEGVDAVLVAGDVYDKGVPSLGAVALLDRFLTALCERHTPVYLISGNHDSAERLAFGGRLLESSGVHLASAFGGRLERFVLEDGHGPVCLWALPFVRPSAVRAALPEEQIGDYTGAVEALVRRAAPDRGCRNLLLAHQFVTSGGAGPETCDSETVNLGTLDNVDMGVFEPFDYVALGHIHTPQPVGRDTVRYCGAPLAYSVTESRRAKTATVVELGAKGEVRLNELPLSPLRPVRRLKGPLEALLQSAERSGDYIYAVLTDETPPLDAAARLRSVYPNLARLEFDLANRPARQAPGPDPATLARRTPADLFAEFYEQGHGRPLSQEEQAMLERALEREGQA